MIFVSIVFTHKVGVAEALLTVLAGVTIMVPFALTLSQPPFNGMI